MRNTFRITPVYDVLLRGTTDMPVGLYHLHLATAEQLTRLHYSSGTIKTVKARLKVLADSGYVVADSIPTRRFRSPYYYSLGTRGLRYLSSVGMEIAASDRATQEGVRHYLFITHTLELNDVIIAASLLRQHDTRFYLAGFIHERALKRQPFKVGNFSLIADAFLEFRVRLPDGRTARLPLLLEHDRGSEQQAQFRRRIAAYIAFLKASGQQQAFGVQTITIAFTTSAGAGRLAQMREWAQAELAKESSALASRFLFTAINVPPDPRQFWLTPVWYTANPNAQPVSLLAD